jgi:hypothetical protein
MREIKLKIARKKNTWWQLKREVVAEGSINFIVCTEKIKKSFRIGC